MKNLRTIVVSVKDVGDLEFPDTVAGQKRCEAYLKGLVKLKHERNYTVGGKYDKRTIVRSTGLPAQLSVSISTKTNT